MGPRRLTPVLLLAAFTNCSSDSRTPAQPVVDRAGTIAAVQGVPAGCQKLEASVYAMFTDTWRGGGVVYLDGQPLKLLSMETTWAEIRDPERLDTGLPYHGAEENTWHFADGDLYWTDRFVGVPGPTPAQMELNQTVAITGGTGRYEGATGQMQGHGPFLLPPAVEGALFIGYDTGHLCLTSQLR